MNLSETEAAYQAEQQRRAMARQARKQARRKKMGAHLDASRILLSLALIAFGVICLLNNLGITSITFGYAINLIWPSLLIILGLILVINLRSVLAMIGGLLLMVAGALFLVNNTGLWKIDFHFAWNILWPLIVVFIGANLLFHEHAASEDIPAAPVAAPPAMPPGPPPAAAGESAEPKIIDIQPDAVETTISPAAPAVQLDKDAPAEGTEGEADKPV